MYIHLKRCYLCIICIHFLAPSIYIYTYMYIYWKIVSLGFKLNTFYMLNLEDDNGPLKDWKLSVLLYVCFVRAIFWFLIRRSVLNCTELNNIKILWLCFPQSVEANGGIVPEIGLWSITATFLPVHCSVVKPFKCAKSNWQHR